MANEMYIRWTRMRFGDKIQMKIEKLLAEPGAIGRHPEEMDETRLVQ